VSPDRKSLIDLDDQGRLRQIGLEPGLPEWSTYTLARPLREKVFMASSDPLVLVTYPDAVEGTAEVFEARDTPDGPMLVPTVSWQRRGLGWPSIVREA